MVHGEPCMQTSRKLWHRYLHEVIHHWYYTRHITKFSGAGDVNMDLVDKRVQVADSTRPRKKNRFRVALHEIFTRIGNKISTILYVYNFI